jgi:hypothetical protein
MRSIYPRIFELSCRGLVKSVTEDWLHIKIPLLQKPPRRTLRFRSTTQGRDPLLPREVLDTDPLKQSPETFGMSMDA